MVYLKLSESLRKTTELEALLRHSPASSVSHFSLSRCVFKPFGSLSVSAGMITQAHILSQNPSFLFFSPNPLIRAHTATPASFLSSNQLPNRRSPLSLSLSRRHVMASNSELSNGVIADAVQDSELDHFAQVANTVADAAGEVIRKYFRKKFDIVDKEDLSKPL
jgi:hypothetical protein